MNNYIFAVFLFNSDRFHKPLASFGAVAGVYVNVFAVKTLWTMICIAAARDFVATVFADKIFDCPFKCFHSLVRLEGIEPPSTVPKTVALSVELQTRSNNPLNIAKFGLEINVF